MLIRVLLEPSLLCLLWLCMGTVTDVCFTRRWADSTRAKVEARHPSLRYHVYTAFQLWIGVDESVPLCHELGLPRALPQNSEHHFLFSPWPTLLLVKGTIR